MLSLFAGLLFTNAKVFSQDPNFYIFLCFGQSNMEKILKVKYRIQLYFYGFRFWKLLIA